MNYFNYSNKISNFKFQISKFSLFFALIAGFLLPVSFAFAQSALSLTITPPLIEVNVGPGNTWNSVLKIVNTNSYDLNLYAQVMDFEPIDENGAVRYMPVTEETSDGERQASLAGWIEIPKEPIFIKKGGSGEIPYKITIPVDAEPGGHYAGILIGNQPASKSGGGFGVSVASYVSSLIMLRVSGEVLEDGRIREFSVPKTIYEKPSVEMKLRFENTGNVHLKPQGDIAVFNMWGRERGKVLLNQKTNFGNVLPKSTRKFDIKWEGEESFFDFGRYSAVATLTFGKEAKRNTSSVLYFWIIPYKPLGIITFSVGSFVFLMFWLIRRYVRKAVELEKIALTETLAGSSSRESGSVSSKKSATLVKPLLQGVRDLKNIGFEKNGAEGVAISEGRATKKRKSFNLPGFFFRYKLFFLFLVLVILAALALKTYFSAVFVTNDEYKYQMEIKNLPSGQ